MAPPVLLTPSTSTTDPPNAGCVKRNVALPPFGLIIPDPLLPGPSSTSTTPTSVSPCDAYDACRTNHSLARQWTGAPIRAIVPLPRRKLVLNGAQNATPSRMNFVPASHTNSVDRTSCLMRSAHFREDADADSGSEIEEDGEGEEGDGGEESDEGYDTPSGSRYCSYESITATEGLAAWSFEELRVECYAQSLIARGTKPPPVVQLSLAIPPAFVPRIVPRS